MSLTVADMGDNLTVNKSDVDENGAETREYRDRLRTWLIKKINSDTIPGLTWENEEKTIFRMPWKHAGRQDYSLEEDSMIFMAWAKHSGRYRVGVDKPEPIVWKTRLRCALNKMPDIRELPERSRLDISEPYRVYQFLPPVHKDSQIRRRTQRRRSQPSSPTPKIELPSRHDQRPMLALPYSNNGLFQDSSARFQASKNPASIFQSPPSGDKPSTVAPWFRSFSYTGNDASVSDKLSPQHPFVDYLNARRIESQQNEQNERIYPKDMFNFRNGPAGFTSGINPHHGSEFGPTVLPNANPMMMSAAGQGLAAFALRHQLGMTGNPAALVSHLTAQVIALEHKFAELTNHKNKLESENEKMKRDERNMQREIKRHQQTTKSIDQIDNENSTSLAKRFECLSSELESINQALKQRGIFMREIKDISTRDSRIEELEKSLSHFRQEHEKEKRERERLETDRERMQTTLQQMGNGLQSLAAVHISPADKEEALQINFESFKHFDENKNKIWNPMVDKSRDTKRHRVSPALDLSRIKRPRTDSTETKEETYSVTPQDEHIDIETPVSNPTVQPKFENRTMTSPCSVSSCTSSVESATSPKSPQPHQPTAIRMFSDRSQHPFFPRSNTIHVS